MGKKGIQRKMTAAGGTYTGKGGGADCAVVVRPAHTNPLFDFRVLEILAKTCRRDRPKD